jgi:hypothetical protein
MSELVWKKEKAASQKLRNSLLLFEEVLSKLVP